MPQVINKIRQNSGDFAGDAGCMLLAFKVGKKTGKEIIDIGESLKPGSGGIIGNKLLKADGDLHLAEQEAICADLDKYMADCIARQRALNDKRRRWLDSETKKLGLTP